MLSLSIKWSAVSVFLVTLALALAGSVGRWAPAAEFPLAAPAPTDMPQQAITPAQAFSALQSRTSATLFANWDRVSGIPDFLTGSHAATRLPYTPSAAERGNAVAIARGFLDENRALFRLRSATDELRLLRVEPDPQLNYRHVRWTQVYHGIPVWGQQLIVHVDLHDQIVAVNGQFIPDINVFTQPTLSQADAEALALENLRAVQLDEDERDKVEPTVLSDRTELVIHVDANGKPTLTWLVSILTTNPLGEWKFFVNARRPRLTYAFDSVKHGKRRVTFSARGTTQLPGVKLADEGELPRDAIGRAAHEGAGVVYDYYFNKFRRDSVDGQGSPLVSTVNYGRDPQDQENAAWIGELQQMIYGDGGRIFRPLATGLDVVGHEFTHGVIDSTAQLIYEAQSGALNESYADVFGVLISGSNWEIGRSVVKSPPFPLPFMRSLSDPNAGVYNPRNPLTGLGQPAHVREYANLPVSRRADNGGVHINSGIPNRAAFLLAQAIGNERVEQIYYRTLTQYLTPRSNFQQMANATLRAAQDLYGANEVTGVRNAFAGVGITVGGGEAVPQAPSPQRPTPEQPAPPVPSQPVPAGCRDIVIDGGFESDNTWREVMGKGNTGIIDTELPRTGRRSAWLGGTDKEPIQYIFQDLNIPPNATRIELTYYRNIHEETTGLLGFLAGEAKFTVLVANNRGEALDRIEELSSRQGDDQWRQARFDVTQLAGKNLRLVFAAENPRGNVSSMFVDDVQMVACTTGDAPSAPPVSSQDVVYVQGRITDGDTGRGVAGAQVFFIKPDLTASQAAADDRVTRDEVLTSGVTDNTGLYQLDAPVQKGQRYSVIVFARGYRPIISDGGANLPPTANNPYRVDATVRRQR